jgi:hypothetical protein
MKIWQNLQQAFLGWQMILRREGNWQEQFRISAAGLVNALVLASLRFDVPTLSGFLDIMVVQSLWLVALLIGVFGTRFVMKQAGSALSVLIPGIYALIAYLAVGSLVSLILGVLLPLLWLALIYMLYRLGRAAGPWSRGVSAAFALLTVVLLVGLPMTLYMLATTFAPIA